MASCESKGFHKFCRKYLPFLLIKCPDGNLHFIWGNKCICETCGCDNGNKYKFNHLKWKWEMINE